MRCIIGFAIAFTLASVQPASAARPAYFEFDYPPRRQTFVIKLTERAKSEHARRILSGEETGAVHVMGKVRRRDHASFPEPGNRLCLPGNRCSRLAVSS
jgi:hypothetical protein